MPYDFKVDWTSGKKGFSEKLETTYYEFSVDWTNKPDTRGVASKSSQSNINYKILAIEEGDTPQFYVLKFKDPQTVLQKIFYGPI